MYCSSCGMTMKAGLSYCNRCGAEVGKESGLIGPAKVDVNSLVWAIVAVTVVGPGSIIGLMAVMKEVLHLNDVLIISSALLVFLSFLLAEGVFIWMLVRSVLGGRQPYIRNRQKGFSTSELGEAKANALPEPALSVTEHTTRTLEPADRETG